MLPAGGGCPAGQERVDACGRLQAHTSSEWQLNLKSRFTTADGAVQVSGRVDGPEPAACGTGLKPETRNRQETHRGATGSLL